jgi:hypothetical protein
MTGDVGTNTSYDLENVLPGVCSSYFGKIFLRHMFRLVRMAN